MPSRLAVVCHPPFHLTAIANTTDPVLLGATNPLASAPGTIRGDYAIVSVPSESKSLQRLISNLGRRPKRLPWLRQRRERQKGNCSVVQQGRSH